MSDESQAKEITAKDILDRVDAMRSERVRTGRPNVSRGWSGNTLRRRSTKL